MGMLLGLVGDALKGLADAIEDSNRPKPKRNVLFIKETRVVFTGNDILISKLQQLKAKKVELMNQIQLFSLIGNDKKLIRKLKNQIADIEQKERVIKCKLGI